MVANRLTQEGTILSPSNTNVTMSNSTIAHNESSCAPIREILSRVGDKWSMLVISILSYTPLHFNVLKRRIEGISQRMLTRTLRELERDGLINRTVEPTTPPKVEYSLTNLGLTLLDPVGILVKWAQNNYQYVKQAQQEFDKHSKIK